VYAFSLPLEVQHAYNPVTHSFLDIGPEFVGGSQRYLALAARTTLRLSERITGICSRVEGKLSWGLECPNGKERRTTEAARQWPAQARG